MLALAAPLVMHLPALLTLAPVQVFPMLLILGAEARAVVARVARLLLAAAAKVVRLLLLPVLALPQAPALPALSPAKRLALV